MFSRIGPNAVKSTDGFSVSRTTRNSIRYTEGQREIDIEVEPGDGLAIYKSSITAWTHGGYREPVLSHEVTRVIENLCAALEFLETPHFVM